MNKKKIIKQMIIGSFLFTGFAGTTVPLQGTEELCWYIDQLAQKIDGGEPVSKDEEDQYLEHMQYLVYERGANINAQDETKGWSLLHIAAKLGRMDIIKKLVSKYKGGIKTNLTDRSGKTPYDIVAEAHNNELQVINDALSNSSGIFNGSPKENPKGKNIGRSQTNKPPEKVVNHSEADVDYSGIEEVVGHSEPTSE
ncbi:MAG: ankyrin repeat domain-containing protein [Puniceicoccales bacterium]|jgi:hypothetical protein|nr:ankyrin repeat domain-containing protein [Puniceicoccales bacterium]